MILICPECQTRFLLPSTAIPIDGRKVRCSVCSHIWLQEKPLDNVYGAGTGPDGDEDADIAAAADKGRKDDAGKGGIIPFLVGMGLVFAVFFAYLLMTPSIPVGEGLAFDDMTVERLGDEALQVSGSIVNTMNDKRQVPVIRLTYMGGAGQEGDSVLFNPDKAVLAAGEVLPVSFALEDIPADVSDIRVSFDIETPTP